MQTNEKLQFFLASTALVIDDEIFDEKSTISNIVKKLEEKGTLFIKKKELIGSIDSLSNISFIILDWDLFQLEQEGLSPEITIGGELSKSRKAEIISFIKKVVEKFFIPIFVFSRENIDMIKGELEKEDIIKHSIECKKLFLSNKSYLKDEQVITALNNWLNDFMAVYTYKIMEESISMAKHHFFNEMFDCNPNWPCHVYQTLKKDNPVDINSDFQDFLLTALTSTIDPIVFNNEGFERAINLNSTEIIKIYSKIKFMYYKDNMVIGPHPGDVYVSNDDSDYYINISASCDMREKKYFFIKGEPCEKTREKKNNNYIIKKFLDKNAVVFCFRKTKIERPTSNYNQITISIDDKNKTYNRKGRLLSPYINAIQEQYSYYIARTGVLRDPDDDNPSDAC